MQSWHQAITTGTRTQAEETDGLREKSFRSLICHQSGSFFEHFHQADRQLEGSFGLLQYPGRSLPSRKQIDWPAGSLACFQDRVTLTPT
ncbi:MAG TPA: hypothetical protein VJA94_23765 [Candidatus Angelobacter sp.]